MIIMFESSFKNAVTLLSRSHPLTEERLSVPLRRPETCPPITAEDQCIKILPLMHRLMHFWGNRSCNAGLILLQATENDRRELLPPPLRVVVTPWVPLKLSAGRTLQYKISYSTSLFFYLCSRNSSCCSFWFDVDFFPLINKVAIFTHLIVTIKTLVTVAGKPSGL